MSNNLNKINSNKYKNKNRYNHKISSLLVKLRLKFNFKYKNNFKFSKNKKNKLLMRKLNINNFYLNKNKILKNLRINKTKSNTIGVGANGFKQNLIIESLNKKINLNLKNKLLLPIIKTNLINDKNRDNFVISKNINKLDLASFNFNTTKIADYNSFLNNKNLNTNNNKAINNNIN